MRDVYELLGRKRSIFHDDILALEDDISQVVKKSSFLVIGAAGSIGSAVLKEIFKRGAKRIHAVDINENGLAELVREIRSEYGYKAKDFDTFCIDCGSDIFQEFFKQNSYDFVLNLSALKHVRSENSAFTMLRMCRVNIENTVKIQRLCDEYGVKKYFCVSSDKASNPANFMGATKRAMEQCVFVENAKTPVSSARFANVAFSNGSLLQGFEQRLKHGHPISAPVDVMRFFITSEEAGQICLLSTLYGSHGEIFFPSHESIKLIGFQDILFRFLSSMDLKPIEMSSEDEARKYAKNGDLSKFWPVYLFNTDTVGEKPYEEFSTSDEKVISEKFFNLSSVYYISEADETAIGKFLDAVNTVDLALPDARLRFLDKIKNFVPTFSHVETGKFLNQRM